MSTAVSTEMRKFFSTRLWWVLLLIMAGYMAFLAAVLAFSITATPQEFQGDKIDVVGISKGKGYAGTIKRYNGHRLRESHGTGPVARHAGSNGTTSSPSRVFKGKKLPGHLGAERVTIQNLTVVKIDAENNLIAIKGAVPGAKGSVVTIHDSVKA